MAPNAPILRIDLASDTPAYEQIVGGLRAILVAGGFQPGDQLPTVRQLAVDLGVHHNTVAEAYRVLAAEGWLDLKRGRGAIVLDRARPKAAAHAKEDFTRKLRELIAKAITDGVSDSAIASQMAEHAKGLQNRPARSAPPAKESERT